MGMATSIADTTRAIIFSIIALERADACLCSVSCLSDFIMRFHAAHFAIGNYPKRFHSYTWRIIFFIPLIVQHWLDNKQSGILFTMHFLGTIN